VHHSKESRTGQSPGLPLIEGKITCENYSDLIAMNSLFVLNLEGMSSFRKNEGYCRNTVVSKGKKCEISFSLVKAFIFSIKPCHMSRIKNFSAKEISGVAGFLIRVEGEVNCGMLDVEPKLTEGGFPTENETILVLEVYPAAEGKEEQFRKASFSKNERQGQYKQVQLVSAEGGQLQTIDVSKA
jgi:hypothetical protein